MARVLAVVSARTFSEVVRPVNERGQGSGAGGGMLCGHRNTAAERHARPAAPRRPLFALRPDFPGRNWTALHYDGGRVSGKPARRGSPAGHAPVQFLTAVTEDLPVTVR